MSDANKIVKEYSNGDVIIVWQPHLCSHSKIYWKGLLPVFDPRRKSWIDLEAASSDKIIAQVGQCLSKALSLKKISYNSNIFLGK